jgi:hypothetical protein
LREIFDATRKYGPGNVLFAQRLALKGFERCGELRERRSSGLSANPEPVPGRPRNFRLRVENRYTIK